MEHLHGECQHIRKIGLRCRNAANGTGFCWLHAGFHLPPPSAAALAREALARDVEELSLEELEALVFLKRAVVDRHHQLFRRGKDRWFELGLDRTRELRDRVARAEMLLNKATHRSHLAKHADCPQRVRMEAHWVKSGGASGIPPADVAWDDVKAAILEGEHA